MERRASSPTVLMDPPLGAALNTRGVIMTKRWLPIILILAVVTALFAQSDTPATREDVMKLFDIMKIHEQMILLMDTVAKQQRTMIHETMRKRMPQITDQELARLDQFTSEIMKDMNLDGMLDDMVPVYQKHLSKSDVDSMNVFYSSPTGQKLMKEMPAMTAESMQAAGPRMQAMMDKMMDRIEKMAEEDRNKEKGSQRPATEKN
jgi:hypothetical protein